MNRVRKIAAVTAAIIVGYVGLTWFYFGSSHPCAIATRMLEWETAAYSDESRLEFARGLAILNLSYTNLEQSKKDKLAEDLKTAPPEVVRKYLDADFTPETIFRDAIESTKTDTPANCVELLYARVKKRLLASNPGR